MKTLDIFFSTMQDQNRGKAATKFQELASELNNIVLANKKYQSTRFVRSLLRGLTAALREDTHMTSDFWGAFLTYLPTLIRYFTT